MKFAPEYVSCVLEENFEDARRLFLSPLLAIHYAHLVMLADRRIVTAEDARALRQALDSISEDQIQAIEFDGTSEDLFFYVNREIEKVCGEDVAGRLHTARSRNDIDMTMYRMRQRGYVLSGIESLLALRDSLIGVADRHRQTILALHTHTQPAQPSTVAHYLLAVVEQLERDTTRLEAAFETTNRCPLGACAITGTGFDIDRTLTSALLGFSGPTGNTYGSIASADYLLENVTATAVMLAGLGRVVQDMLLWCTDEFGYLRLGDGFVQGSSIMPQKRNPAALEQLRAQASIMLGEMQTVFLMAHNNRTGMFDYRSYDPVPCGRPLQVFKLLLQVVDGIVVNKERALAEVNADYSTTTEIADALAQRAGVPFRIGHHFASKLTDYGRGKGVKIHDIPHAEVARIYEADTKQAFPLSEADFREVISAEYMVFGRKGVGGPQLAEMNRMLAEEGAKIAADLVWIKDRTDHLARSEAVLDQVFAALAKT